MLIRLKRQILICAGLIALTLALFSRVGGYDFVDFDDGLYVFRNGAIQQGCTLENVHNAFFQSHG